MTNTKTTTCNRCATAGLTWKKSAKGRWYLQETVYVRSQYSTRRFPQTRLHLCPTHNPEPGKSGQVEAPKWHTVYGEPLTVVEDPATHEHTWHSWRLRPGSDVVGVYCYGCNGRLID